MNRPKYDLYYTLNKNIPRKALTEKDRKNFLTKISQTDESQQKAILLLMYEHALVEKKIDYDADELLVPYDCTQTKTGIQFNMNKIPQNLQWILYKFLNILKKIN